MYSQQYIHEIQPEQAQNVESSLSIQAQDSLSDNQHPFLSIPNQGSMSLCPSPTVEPSKSTSAWTYEQQQLIFKLHNEFGNKWSLIAEHFHSSEKSDNSVKNHFYSRLRKSLRKLNKIILAEFKKQRIYKELKPNVIYKVIEGTELKHKKAQRNEVTSQDCLDEDENNIELCFDLKNRLLEYSYDRSEPSEKQQQDALKTGKQLIEDLVSFTKTYKRKSTTSKKSKSPYPEDDDLPTLLKPKSKKSSLYRETKSFGSIMIGTTQCGLFQSISSSPTPVQVTTRSKRAKSGQFQQLSQKPQSQTSTPTIASFNMSFKEKTESFFKDSGLLDDYFLPSQAMMTKKEPQNYDNIEKMNDCFGEMEICEYEYASHEESSSHQTKKMDDMKDHFDDPQLDEAKFSVFE